MDWIVYTGRIPITVILPPPPFPGFDPREEAERRGFTRPLPQSPRP
jgi:hypothetical protein